jgi:hypothetical protein
VENRHAEKSGVLRAPPAAHTHHNLNATRDTGLNGGEDLTVASAYKENHFDPMHPLTTAQPQLMQLTQCTHTTTSRLRSTQGHLIGSPTAKRLGFDYQG